MYSSAYFTELSVVSPPKIEGRWHIQKASKTVGD